MLRAILAIPALHLDFFIGGDVIQNRAAFFDLDGTLISVHVWHGIMEYFKTHDLRQWTHKIYMAYHFPYYISWKLGIISEQTFQKPWPVHLGWYLRGYSIEQANQIWEWVTNTEVSNNWRTDTCQILHRHQEQGDLTFLVSGTPVPLLHWLAREINADHVVGTQLEIKDGKFTGKNSSPACIGEEKVTLTMRYIKKVGLDIDFANSFAYADSLSDQYLLGMVGHPTVTYPDDQLKQLAIQRNWGIFPPD